MCTVLLVSYNIKLKVPITPKIFSRRDESLSHVEQNGAKIFGFGQNWNFL